MSLHRQHQKKGKRFSKLTCKDKYKQQQTISSFDLKTIHPSTMFKMQEITAAKLIILFTLTIVPGKREILLEILEVLRSLLSK
jgi:hypothetical protein